jgi:hypothetical protein
MATFGGAADIAVKAAMKVLFILAIGVLAVLFLTSACEFNAYTVSSPPQTAKDGITGVSSMLEQATKAGDPPKPGSAAARLNTECAKRDLRLGRLPRPTKLTDIAPHARRVLAVLHAHNQRAARLGAPPQVLAFNADHERAVSLLASAARAKNYRGAQRQATALRELAGRANNELMRLGLNECMLRSTGMPL